MATGPTDILRDPHALHEALAQMTPAQKLALIEQIARGVPRSQPEPDPEAQRRNLQELLDETAKLSVQNPADGFSGRDHDDLLYARRS